MTYTFNSLFLFFLTSQSILLQVLRPLFQPSKIVAVFLYFAASSALACSMHLASADTHPHKQHTPSPKEAQHSHAHHHHGGGQADGHAPIGVMGDHGHGKGGVMLSYRLMAMKMTDMLIDEEEISASELLGNSNFMVAPRDMDMWMHMVGAMVGLGGDWTVSTMIPYLSNSMVLDRNDGSDFKMKSKGLGDISLTFMNTFFKSSRRQALISFGFLLPTGSISEMGSGGNIMGYHMQLGSGSVAFRQRLTYTAFINRITYGMQLGFTHFINDNERNYLLGNRYLANLWGSFRFFPSWSASLRFNYTALDPIRGRDSRLNPMMSPLNDSGLQDGKIGSVFIGTNLLSRHWLPGHRLALEFGIPVYQNLSGPQMKTDWQATLGWQKAF